ncbi:MAG: hypothetical protein U9R79_02825 [Armatimonadota bacterium]|nr:hypothetical protein [Armatimonadota bacterium]
MDEDRLAAGREFVGRARERGISDEQITQSLREGGWTEASIEELSGTLAVPLGATVLPPPPPPPPPREDRTGGVSAPGGESTCPVCGARVFASDQRCMECGARLDSKQVVAPPAAPGPPRDVTGEPPPPSEPEEPAGREPTPRESEEAAAEPPPPTEEPAQPEPEGAAAEPGAPSEEPTPAQRPRRGIEVTIGTAWLTRIGMVAVLLAVAFLLKYAYSEGWITPQMLLGAGTWRALRSWAVRSTPTGGATRSRARHLPAAAPRCCI